MTIGEQAKALFEKHEPKGSLATAILRCFLYGVLVKRPDFIVMGEPVFTDGKAVLAVAPECSANCWWVWYAGSSDGSATPCDFIAETPYPLPYIGFKRRGKVKIYRSEKIQRELERQG